MSNNPAEDYFFKKPSALSLTCANCEESAATLAFVFFFIYANLRETSADKFGKSPVLYLPGKTHTQQGGVSSDS